MLLKLLLSSRGGGGQHTHRQNHFALLLKHLSFTHKKFSNSEAHMQRERKRLTRTHKKHSKKVHFFSKRARAKILWSEKFRVFSEDKKTKTKIFSIVTFSTVQKRRPSRFFAVFLVSSSSLIFWWRAISRIIIVINRQLVEYVSTTTTTTTE